MKTITVIQKLHPGFMTQVHQNTLQIIKIF